MSGKRFEVFAIAIAILTIGVLMVNVAKARGETGKALPTQITVDNFTFTPGTLTVPVNSTVTWMNKDDVPHVIASTDGLFRSKGLDTDDHFSYTFTKPGTYAYFCSIHPKMVGKIVVQ